MVIRDGRRAGARRVAILSEPWLYCAPATRNLYVVPAGYVTDFASVPWPATVFYPPFGDWVEAAVIHDWLYDVGQTGERSNVDHIFREAVAEQTGSGLTPTLMYWCVRAGGRDAYERAGRRELSEWKSHFLDRRGQPLTSPPFPQPIDPVWRRNVNCSQLESDSEVRRLLDEYEAEAGRDLSLR